MKKYLALIFAVLMLTVMFALSVSAEETFINPVANGADPFVFKDTDGTYYLYVTSGGNYGYRVYTSTNLVEWESQGYCLKPDDVFIDSNIGSGTVKEDDSWTKNVYPNLWAPEVIEHNGTYYMVYSAQEHLGIATSDSPLGPFKNDKTGYLIPYEITGTKDTQNKDANGNVTSVTRSVVSTQKCIDGHFYKDVDTGKVYLYFVSCGSFSLNGYSVDAGNNIWGGEFDLETLSFVNGGPKLLVESPRKNKDYLTGWPSNSILGLYDGSRVSEGPEILKHDGKYYLTYSQDGYESAKYSVWYVTSTDPLDFSGAEKKLAFISDDTNKEDASNPHLYGTAHHCFTTSPDGSELIIVYHAHRSINSVQERRICIDLAGFDADGTLWAGRAKKGNPTATAQVLPSGGTLEREEHLEGSFADLVNLPTVYVSNEDGDDSADGTAAAPLKTITAACAKLENGGTIILTQLYNAVGETSADYLSIPAVNGPLMIRGAMKATPLSFKYLSINSDIYFENISFWPATQSYISVIECNYNNVVMGEGVSCISQPKSTYAKYFPVLVGGKWWSSEKTTGVYANFKHTSNADVTSDKEYAITVYSGTWSIATEKSVKAFAEVADSASNATLTLTGDAKVRPAKTSAPTVKATVNGAVVTFKGVEFAPKYVVYKDGEVAGYTETTTFVDAAYTFGEEVAYSVAGYVNGACIADVSAATTFSFIADVTGDGIVDVTDVITLLKNILNNQSQKSLLDVLLVLKLAIKA